MEVAGFLRTLMTTNLQLDVDITEVVTDQNLSIVKLMALAKKDPDAFVASTVKLLHNYQDASDRDYHVLLCMLCHSIKHSLDVWHRAKNIGKALMKVSDQSKGFDGSTKMWVHSENPVQNQIVE